MQCYAMSQYLSQTDAELAILSVRADDSLRLSTTSAACRGPLRFMGTIFNRLLLAAVAVVVAVVLARVTSRCPAIIAATAAVFAFLG